MRLFAELSRRNVIRGAIAYAAVGWLIIEVGSVLLPAFKAPDWVLQTLIIIIFTGFLPALILAWRYELTPGGPMEETAAESHLEARRTNHRAFDAALADMDHALLLRQEGRATEAQALADRALAWATAENPLDEGDAPDGIGNLYFAQMAAVAGDHETSRAYRALAPSAESFPWVWWRAMIECASGELDALSGDAASGWARYAPYADDPYLCSSRAAMRASPFHRLIFRDVPAFKEFIEAN